MNKYLFGVISILVWTFGISIVLFNNLHQLTLSILQDKNLLISFLAVCIGVAFYGIYNKKKLRKEIFH